MENINLKKLAMPIRSDTHVLLAGDPVFTEYMKKELLEESLNIKLSTIFNSNDMYDYIFIFEHSTVKSAISLKSISAYLSPLFAPAAAALEARARERCAESDIKVAKAIGRDDYYYINSIRQRYLLAPGGWTANDLFMNLYDQCTQNNECLVIDMNSRIEESVYWYKPKFTTNQ